MKLFRILGWLLGLMAVAAYVGLGWENTLEQWWATATIIALVSTSITLLTALSSEGRNRLLISLLGSAIAWVALVVVMATMTLAKLGRFEEGGPIGLALVIGFYLGLPISVLTLVLTFLTRRILWPRLARPSERN